MATPQKILLIEDDTFLSSLLTSRLTKEGFEVQHATDGDQAIEFLKASKPDLILLDIILPKKSGFEVLEEIQKNAELNRGPVIIISNLGQEEDVSRGKELGAITYFIKAKTPIDTLVTNIKDYLAQTPKA